MAITLVTEPPCVTWRKSSLSRLSNCVEVVFGHDQVRMRNSKDNGSELRFSYREWDEFVRGAQDGQFDSS